MTLPLTIEQLSEELATLYHLAVNGSIRAALYEAIQLGYAMAERDLKKEDKNDNT